MTCSDDVILFDATGIQIVDLGVSLVPEGRHPRTDGPEASAPVLRSGSHVCGAPSQHVSIFRWQRSHQAPL